MANNESSDKSDKSMGLLSATSIGIGGMIGAGIFSIIGVAANIAKQALPFSFLIGGGVALLSVYSFGKLTKAYPSAGGPVEFLVRGLGKNWISGSFNILLWMGYVFALALYARAFGGYAGSLMPEGVSGMWQSGFITGIVFLFVMVNAVGAGAVGKSEVVIVVAKLLILLGFIAVGSFFIEPARLSFSRYPDTFSVIHGGVIVFIAYEGFGLITNAAGDVKNPRRVLPKALFLSVFVTIMVYVAIAVTVVGNLPIPEIVQAKDHALAKAAEPFLGRTGFTIVSVAALFSIASAINATLYGATNISYIIARKGQLPRVFDRKVWQDSREGLYITAGFVILLANVANLSQIAMLGSSLFLIIYGVINVGHLLIIEETSASFTWVLLSVVGCFFPLGFLVFQSYQSNPLTVYLLAGLFVASFVIELLYSYASNREMNFNPLHKNLFNTVGSKGHDKEPSRQSDQPEKQE